VPERVDRQAGEQRPGEVSEGAGNAEIAEIARALLGSAQGADEILERDVKERVKSRKSLIL